MACATTARSAALKSSGGNRSASRTASSSGGDGEWRWGSPRPTAASMRRLAPTLLQRDDTCRLGERIRGIAARRAKAGRNTEYIEHVFNLGTK